MLDAAPPESFLVVDALDPLEAAPRADYRAFLNDLKELMEAQDSVALLHCLDTQDPPGARGLTLNRVDQVWWLQMQLLSQEIKNRLYVTKARTNRSLKEPLTLVMTDQVRIDTTRNI